MKTMENSRKTLSKKERKKITGGDVLQIEDFQVDMTRIMKSAGKESEEEKEALAMKRKSVLHHLNKFKSDRKAITDEEKSQKQYIKDLAGTLETRYEIP